MIIKAPLHLPDPAGKRRVDVAGDLGVHNPLHLPGVDRFQCIQFRGADAEALLEAALTALGFLDRRSRQAILASLILGQDDRL